MSAHCNKNKKGLTLIEILISVVLISIVFVGVASLYVASKNFSLIVSDKTIINYELQFASQHIYKSAMQAIGDETSAPGTSGIQLPNSLNNSTDRLEIRINNSNPLTSGNYSSATVYSYYKSGNALIFDNGVTQENLIPKVTVTDVNFLKDVGSNIVTGYITAYYRDSTRPLTFYFSCYPRLASFN